MPDSGSTPMSCPVGCSGCDDGVPRSAAGDELIVGVGLVISVILVFLVPLATAVLGAYLGRTTSASELGGGLLGLLLGMGIARVLWAAGRWFYRSEP